MPKRVNGEGSIRKRGNKYQGRITVIDQNGELKTHSFTRDTKADVAEKLREIAARVQQGKPAVDSNMTVEQWVTVWIKGPLVVSSRRTTTQDQYRLLLENHVVTALGNVRLRDLKPRQVEVFLADLLTRRSASTARSTYAAFRGCMDTAVRDGLIATNPVAKVDRPVAARTKSRALTLEQVRELVKSAEGSRLKHFIVLLAATGLRMF